MSGTPVGGASAGERDYRVDFFRGVALLAIFVNHIPDNLFSLVTTRNWGFSDASEIFIFLSGYSAALVFEGRRRSRGVIYASMENLRRVWTLYVVHVFVFVLFIAQVALTAERFGNPMYVEEMKVGDFLAEPHIAVVEALLLRFQPRFLDILPLYIVLLLLLPLATAIPRRLDWIPLVFGAVVYLAVPILGISPHAYPNDRQWTFNPFAWQFLFAIGIWFGRRQLDPEPTLRPRPRLMIFVLAYLLFAAVVQISWTIAGLYPSFPALLEAQLWPLDKTNLSPWRLVHFLCLAYVVARLTRADHAFFRSRFAKPFVVCGQNSLNVFCLGIFLSFFGHLIQVELSDAVWAQGAVFLAGCAAMMALAHAQSWYKRAFGRPNKPPVGGTRVGPHEATT